LGEALIEEVPEFQSTTTTSNRYSHPQGTLTQTNKNVEGKGLFVYPNFFDFFSYPLKNGDATSLLKNKKNIVLSEKLAETLFFSASEAMGQLIEWESHEFKDTFKVTGVFFAPPKNATTQFDFVLPFEKLIEIDEHAGNWNGDYAETFVEVEAGTNMKILDAKIANFLHSKANGRDRFTLFTQKYSERYLNGQFENGKLIGGRIAYVRLFVLIALFILLIACINFMNLSTAKASRKMKEIGVKKTIGATRGHLINQFLGESIIMVLLGFIAALFLTDLSLPYFNQLTNKELILNLTPQILFSFLGIIFITGLLAGSYPAFYLSNFKPMSILKGIRQTALSEVWIRKGLVVFQFALAVLFIVGVLVVHQQIQYIQTKNLGYNRDNVLTFQRGPNDRNSAIFINEIKQINGVSNAGNMYWSVLDGTDSQGGFHWGDRETQRKIMFKSPRIGYDLVETLDMEVLAGRTYSRDFKNEHDKILINQTALNIMGLEDPIGKTIGKGKQETTIIGVVNDFHYGSIHQKIEPLIFRFREHGNDILVRLNMENNPQVIEEIKGVFKQFHPNQSFNFSFLDADYQALYESENRIADLSKYFSLLAILISCLGLFGLAAYTAERRSKEIGVRKILGASTWSIVQMLSGDFTKMVGLGILIALPISYFFVQNWLNNFVYHINFQWWIFIVAALSTLLIAWLTVSLQTYKAANVHPVESLKE